MPKIAPLVLNNLIYFKIHIVNINHILAFCVLIGFEMINMPKYLYNLCLCRLFCDDNSTNFAKCFRIYFKYCSK